LWAIDRPAAGGAESEEVDDNDDDGDDDAEDDEEDDAEAAESEVLFL
jgi:hypothetical protein